jgi:hypothetical protein
VKGDYKKTIEVETNDPDMQILRLTIKVKIQEILSIVPMDVNFGTVKTGSVNKRMITLANKGKEPLKITAISANPSNMLSVFRQGSSKISPGESISVEIQFQAGPPTNFFFGTMHVETDDEKAKSKDVRIRPGSLELTRHLCGSLPIR